MGNDIDLKKEWKKKLETINQINFYLKDYKNEIIDLCKKNQHLKKHINNFNINYARYIELERFSIPVIGKISSGKSTILNFILDLKESLQVESKITTKFVCIIRHNKTLKGQNPKLYNVNFVKRSELDNHFNFEKGDLIEGDIKSIIGKRNRDLNDKKIDDIPQNYFLLIENYIPFFENEYEKYADFFEFLDIPGLNEISSNINEDNIYFKKILPFIINNIKFSLFIFETRQYQTMNSIKIYKQFIEKINQRNKDYFNENIILNDEQKYSIYILNKIDLCDKVGGIEKEKEDFKNYLIENLNVDLNINYTFFLNSKESILSKDKFKSFDDYLNYVIGKDKDSNNFIQNLNLNLQRDFNLNNIEPNFNDDDEDEQSEKTTLLNNKLKSSNFDGELSEGDYKYYKNIYDENKEGKNDKKNEINKLLSLILNSIEKTIHNFIINNDIEYLENEIQKNFIKDKFNISKLNIKIPTISSTKILNNKNYTLTLNKLGEICEQLKELEPNHDFIKQIYNNYLNTKKYINEEYKYRIAFLGGISTGKSSIINSLIGYNLDLIPKSSDHCTKIILVIQYTESQDNISVYETKFDKHNDYSNFYYFSKNRLIAKGKEEAKKVLDDLNRKKVDNDEIPYYILQTPIEFLDDNIKETKNKLVIEFIDLPGFNNNGRNFDEFLRNLINFTELFLFINDKNLIQAENKDLIQEFFEILLSEKHKFNLDSIMFVVNQIDLMKEIKNINDINNIMKTFSEEINDIYKNIINDEWNKQLKYSEIIQNNKGLLFSYFSNVYYRENKNKQKTLNKHFNNSKELIKYIIEIYNLKNCKSEIIIKGLSKKIEKDYLNKLKNKKEYNAEEIKDIKSVKTSICNILRDNNITSDDIKKNESVIEEITKKYIFIKNNIHKYEYNYNFEDFFSNIMNKIEGRKVAPKNRIIFKFINELNNDFKLIKDNLKRHELNLKIPMLHEEKELQDIYDEFVKIVKDDFKKKYKELEKIVDIIINEENSDIYYQIFIEKFNELSSFLTDTSANYSILITKTFREINERYSIDHINRAQDLISIDFSGVFDFIDIVYLQLGFFIDIFRGDRNFTLFSYIKGRIIKRKRIHSQFKTYFDKINSIKKKILTDMKLLYDNSLKELRITKISQQKPLINIYKNTQEFKQIQNDFINICNEIENNN